MAELILPFGKNLKAQGSRLKAQGSRLKNHSSRLNPDIYRYKDSKTTP
jgi:hypothetical protein